MLQGIGHRRLKVRIALQAAYGMAYLHSQGMVSQGVATQVQNTGWAVSTLTLGFCGAAVLYPTFPAGIAVIDMIPRLPRLPLSGPL
jgi:hypothetical protein